MYCITAIKQKNDIKEEAHQRRVIRVSETFVKKLKQRGLWPVPATAGCCVAKVHWTVCLSLATLTGDVTIVTRVKKFISFAEMGVLERTCIVI